jgi:hypothetical protein
VVLVAAGARVLDYGRDDLAGAVVALAASHVGDLDLPTAELWRRCGHSLVVLFDLRI